MGRSTRRGPWLPDEDRTLLHLVHIQGPNNWVRISQHMQHRSPKQCRERYHQNLKPSLNHEPISNEEGEHIEQLVQEMGKRWAEIARRLGNRSDNAVKNWWNGSMNRRRRNTTHSTARAVGPRQLPVPATAPPRAERDYSPDASYSSHSRPYAVPPDHSATGYHHSLPRPDLAQSTTGHNSFQNAIEQHFSSRAAETAHISPGPLGFCASSITNPSLSAPSSLQVTPSALFTRELHPPITHGLRPPPLEHRPASYSDWQGSRLQEASAISPAGTEYSVGPSFHQAPSLVSDNQSHYSISPKTMSSPRPAMLAPIDTSNHNWYAEQRRNSYITYPQTVKAVQDEGYVSAIPPSALINETASESFPLDPSLRRAASELDPRTKGDVLSPLASSPTGKDSRMNVASLLD